MSSPSPSPSPSSKSWQKTKAERLHEQKMKRRALARSRKLEVEKGAEKRVEPFVDSVASSNKPLKDTEIIDWLGGSGKQTKPKSRSNKMTEQSPPLQDMQQKENTPQTLNRIETKQQPYNEMHHMTATHIQAQYRAHQGKKQFQAEKDRQHDVIRKEIEIELRQDREMAAVMIQSTYRGLQGRNTAVMLQLEEQRLIQEQLREEEAMEDHAALQMQRLSRGKLARMQLEEMKAKEVEAMRREIEQEMLMGSTEEENEEKYALDDLPATPVELGSPGVLGTEAQAQARVDTDADGFAEEEKEEEAKGEGADASASSNARASAEAADAATPTTADAKAAAKADAEVDVKADAKAEHPRVQSLWGWTSGGCLTPRGHGAPPLSSDASAMGDAGRISSDPREVLEEIRNNNNTIRVHCTTWNLHAKDGPSNLSTLLPRSHYHIYAIGTEECERSIAKSAVFKKKANWEGTLKQALGEDYGMLCSHTLQAIHLIVFCHVALLPRVQRVESSAVATGLANKMGNKGGIGISFGIGATSLLFVNCHLTAHQHKEEDRNKDAEKIELQLRLPRNKTAAEKQIQKATQRFDQVVWMGDLNYRVELDREQVDKCIAGVDMPTLLAADQLGRNMQEGKVFDNLVEGELVFPPTYKLDAGTLTFDSGPKQRVPSWTDRVLYKPNQGITQTSYNCSSDYKTSDHLPVYSTFDIKVDVDEVINTNGRVPTKYGQNKSQVCLIS